MYLDWPRRRKGISDERKSIRQDTLPRISDTGAFGAEDPAWVEQRDHVVQKKPAVDMERKIWSSYC